MAVDSTLAAQTVSNSGALPTESDEEGLSRTTSLPTPLSAVSSPDVNKSEVINLQRMSSTTSLASTTSAHSGYLKATTSSEVQRIDQKVPARRMSVVSTASCSTICSTSSTSSAIESWVDTVASSGRPSGYFSRGAAIAVIHDGLTDVPENPECAQGALSLPLPLDWSDWPHLGGCATPQSSTGEFDNFELQWTPDERSPQWVRRS